MAKQVWVVQFSPESGSPVMLGGEHPTRAAAEAHVAEHFLPNLHPPVVGNLAFGRTGKTQIPGHGHLEFLHRDSEVESDE